MKLVETEIVRRVDDFGRIAIPKMVRQQLEIQENDYFEFVINSDKSITLRKVEKYSIPTELNK